MANHMLVLDGSVRLVQIRQASELGHRAQSYYDIAEWTIFFVTGDHGQLVDHVIASLCALIIVVPAYSITLLTQLHAFHRYYEADYVIIVKCMKLSMSIYICMLLLWFLFLAFVLLMAGRKPQYRVWSAQLILIVLPHWTKSVPQGIFLADMLR